MPNPLYIKLGIKSGYAIRLVNPPDNYYSFFEEFPVDVSEIDNPSIPKDVIHYFAQSQAQLINDFPLLVQEIKQNGMIWISWIKKSAKIPTDLDGNFIREYGLSCGVVDCKICSVSDIWSGMKFMIRIKDRKK